MELARVRGGGGATAIAALGSAAWGTGGIAARVTSIDLDGFLGVTGVLFFAELAGALGEVLATGALAGEVDLLGVTTCFVTGALLFCIGLLGFSAVAALATAFGCGFAAAFVTGLPGAVGADFFTMALAAGFAAAKAVFLAALDGLVFLTGVLLTKVSSQRQ